MLTLYLSLLTSESDQDYITRLYTKLNRRLLGYAYKLTGDVSWAQDATQQVFLTVIEKIEKFTQMSDDEVAAYCFTIVKNSHIKNQTRESKVIYIDLMENRLSDSEINSPIEDEVYDHLEYAEVKKAVAQLPEQRRMVIALKYGFGLSHSEIAQNMGISASYSQNLLAAAIKQLREILGEGLTHETK